ncbi:MAG TPA: hypothetical protein PKA29_01080 [Candidatus Saccharibacteria bacterium]|jgi:hypothetical protein|nr:hypothetical protein [Candidatus Saccharibacteria bacterium]
MDEKDVKKLKKLDKQGLTAGINLLEINLKRLLDSLKPLPANFKEILSDIDGDDAIEMSAGLVGSSPSSLEILNGDIMPQSYVSLGYTNDLPDDYIQSTGVYWYSEKYVDTIYESKVRDIDISVVIEVEHLFGRFILYKKGNKYSFIHEYPHAPTQEPKTIRGIADSASITIINTLILDLTEKFA